jgi:hypothetical protein
MDTGNGEGGSGGECEVFKVNGEDGIGEREGGS